MSDAKLILQTLGWAGASIEVRGDSLNLTAPEPLPAWLTAQIKLRKPEIIAELSAEDRQAEFDERAAISEHDGGLSRERAELLAALQTVKLPPDLPREHVAKVIDFAARHADAMTRKDRRK